MCESKSSPLSFPCITGLMISKSMAAIYSIYIYHSAYCSIVSSLSKHVGATSFGKKFRNGRAVSQAKEAHESHLDTAERVRCTQAARIPFGSKDIRVSRESAGSLPIGYVSQSGEVREPCAKLRISEHAEKLLSQVLPDSLAVVRDVERGLPTVSGFPFIFIRSLEDHGDQLIGNIMLKPCPEGRYDHLKEEIGGTTGVWTIGGQFSCIRSEFRLIWHFSRLALPYLPWPRHNVRCP